MKVQNRRKLLITSLLALFFVLLAAIGVLMLLGPNIGDVFSTINSSLNSTGATSSVLSVQDQLAQVDQALNQTMKSSIAYNIPSSMKLDDTATIELLLNPSKTTDQLAGQIEEGGAIKSGNIDITSSMKAELITLDPEAFSIRSIPEDPVQPISATENTKWDWLITAKKGGSQTLTLVIYRLVKYQGQGYWREVETYKANILVNVTFAQRFESLDWKWILGIILTAIAIPAFWRWFDQRKKPSEETGKAKKKK